MAAPMASYIGRRLEEEYEGHDGGLHYGDVAALTCATLIALVLLSVIFDVAFETLSGKLEKVSEKDQKMAAYKVLWETFKCEITTLGFLAFSMFIFGQAPLPAART